MTDKTLIELVEEYGEACFAGNVGWRDQKRLLTEIKSRLASRMRLDIELDDGTECDLTVYGSERDINRLAARLSKLVEDERLASMQGAVVVPDAIYQLECLVPARGSGVIRYWVDCDKATYDTEHKAGGPCRIVYAAPSLRTLTAEEWERMERDAARYRFVKLQSDEFCVTQNIGHDWMTVYGHEMDAAIDAAIAKQEGGLAQGNEG